jgi:hypothetical protein
VIWVDAVAELALATGWLADARNGEVVLHGAR